MPGFPVLMFLLSSSVVGMTQVTGTQEFNRCFSRWAHAEQVLVDCGGIKIAQYCDPDQSCPTKNKPGVSLKKDSNGVCITITNCSSLESWFCEAVGYIKDKQQEPENFTVLVCNQQTYASSSPGSSSTSSSPSNNESQTGTIAAGVGTPIIVLLIIFIVLFMVKHFKKAIHGFFSCLLRNNRNPNQEPGIKRGEDSVL